MKDPISYDDFEKLDIRIGTVLSAEKVPETDKLLKLMIDLGEESPRQIISGIAAYFPDPGVLVGLSLPVLANLEPRIIRGVESQGMILAASNDSAFSVLIPQNKMTPGSRVK